MSDAPAGWLRAIDEALVAAHLGTAEGADDYETARKKLNALIDWHVQVALDPAVNGGRQLVPVEPPVDGACSGCGDEIHPNYSCSDAQALRSPSLCMPEPPVQPFGYLRQASTDRNPPHGWAFHFFGQTGDIAVYLAPTLRMPEPMTEDEIMDAFCETPGIHQFIEAFRAGVRFAERRMKEASK